MATEAIVTGQKQRHLSRLVDMWIAPGLNPTNIEILTKLKTAEDRQFSKNMAVTGKMFDEDKRDRSREESHLIGIRFDLWKPTREARERALAAIQRRRAKELRDQKKQALALSPDEKALLEEEQTADALMNAEEQDVDKSRLVLKMFRTTGNSIRWRGSIEELSASEIHQSLGSRAALASFAVVLAEHEYVTHIHQCRRFLRLPPSYSFAYYQEASDRIWYIDLLCHWVSLGIDYRITAQGQTIGVIDGHLLALGVNSRIRVNEPALAEDARFMDLLSLFAASIGFHRRIRGNIRRRLRAIRQGKSVHIVDDDEMWLLKNPRRMAR